MDGIRDPAQDGQAARQADLGSQILNAATPADLPVEQPTKFEIAVNFKTTKAIGVELRTSILLRADE